MFVKSTHVAYRSNEATVDGVRDALFILVAEEAKVTVVSVLFDSSLDYGSSSYGLGQQK